MLIAVGGTGADDLRGRRHTPLPPDTHCPAGFALPADSQFDSVYQDWLHTVVDVNENGYVCARKQPEAVSTAQDTKLGLPPGFPVYLAGDDTIAR
jgi:hypothetical protein